jgi:cytochrome c peroxidase
LLFGLLWWVKHWLARNPQRGIRAAFLVARVTRAWASAFKAPSHRNVTLGQVVLHNGRFKSLKDALTFYVRRDTATENWYPGDPDGGVNKFNALPPAWRANVNTSEAPTTASRAMRRRSATRR